MLSIIFPTKQEEKYIADAVKQFKDLSVPHEVIVSDGRSTDKTVEVARALADKVIVYQGEHHNPGIGRNDGAREARGDFLLFLDADTRLPNANQFVQDALAHFERDPKLVALAFPQHTLPELEKFMDKIVFGIDNLNMRVRNNFLHSGWACGKCMLIRKRAFDAVGGFNTKLVFGEDWDLYTRLAKIGGTLFVPNLPYYHFARRLHKLGPLRFWWTWGVNWASVAFSGKARAKEWTPVR